MSGGLDGRRVSTWGGRKVARLRRQVVATYGARCYLNGPYCRETGSRAIDLRLRFPHRGSLSIEHVDARRFGGGDDVARLRPAHLACNASKGDGTRARAQRPVRAAESGSSFFEREPGKPRSPLPFPPDRPQKNAETTRLERRVR